MLTASRETFTHLTFFGLPKDKAIKKKKKSFPPCWIAPGVHAFQRSGSQ